MSYIPSADDLLEVLPARSIPAPTKTQSTITSQNKDKTMSLVEKEGQFTIPVTAEELSIPEEKLRLIFCEKYSSKQKRSQTLLMV